MSMATAVPKTEHQAQVPALLQVAGLAKRYGEQLALADISFAVQERDVLGLIRPNGAGKTTLLETIAGILASNGGQVLWRGAPLSLRERREVMFYLPDALRPWQDQHVISVIKFFAEVYDRPDALVAQTLRALDLAPVLRQRVLTLSKGYARRLMLALALITPQPLLLMDEPLVGYSFFQAVALYGEASGAARDSPLLATGLSPLDGLLVPTFGALYVAVTLLFPFVAIRTLGREKESGTLRLLIQQPYRVSTLIAAKMATIGTAWIIAATPVLSALLIWKLLGGHLHPAETLNLLLGQFLYGLLVGAIALFAAAISESSATAAIVTLAFTIGSWVLDFALAGQPGMLEWISRLSLTQTLRPFEQGVLSLGLLLGIIVASGAFATLAGLWLHPGVPLRTKLARSLACAGPAA